MNKSIGPACIGIIMDGNRRWAAAREVSVFDGHTAGYSKLKEVLRWAHAARVSDIVAYAFSTENWKRPEREVGYLMQLFRSILENEAGWMADEKVRVRFVGDRARFSLDLQRLMSEMEATTAGSYEITLHLLMSYSGRAEIVAAVNKLLAESSGPVTETSFAQALWSVPMPDPDLIIRTGGERRLSNFLSWQSVYSELFFVDSFWPDFSKEEFDAALAEFATRERRHGK